MDRCPNCDAAVRPNAKFCTSCGFRLPTPEPAKPSEPWRSPFATTANYEHNQTWTAPVAPPQPVEPSPEPIAAAPAEPAPAQEPAPVFAGWPNFATSTIPAEQPTQAAAADVPEHDADAPAPSETREPASAAVEEAHAQELDDLARQYDERHGKSGGNQPFAWAAPLAETAEAEPESQPESAAESESEPEPLASESTAMADSAVEAASEPVETEAVAASAPADTETKAAGEPAEAEAEVEAADEPTEPIPAMAARIAGDAAQRALDLLDELRSLIPSLGSAADSGSTDVRGILLDADVPMDDSDELEQLRAAIDTACNRPRDIDVMLDLVSRAGAIRDALAERDRFAAAIARALVATDASKE
jgi:hypothetical protein